MDDSDLVPREKANIAGLAQDAYTEYVRKSPLAVLDEGVEMLAKLVEPEIKAGTSDLKLYGIDLPRQVGAEVLRAYKPSVAAPFYLGGKLLAKAAKPIGKPIAKAIGKKIPKKVKDIFLKEFTIGKGRPVDYRNLTRTSELEKAIGAREAQKVAETLTKTKGGAQLTREEQRYMGRIFRKEIDLGGKKSPFTYSPEKTAKIAKNIEVEIAFNPKC